jgi:hypothetical protein
MVQVPEVQYGGPIRVARLIDTKSKLGRYCSWTLAEKDACDSTSGRGVVIGGVGIITDEVVTLSHALAYVPSVVYFQVY